MKNIAIVLFLAILMALASVASASDADPFKEVPISQGVCVGADKITDPLLGALFCKKLAIQWHQDNPDPGNRHRHSFCGILVLDSYSTDRIEGRYAWSVRQNNLPVSGGTGEIKFVARIEGNTLYVILPREDHIEITITPKKDGTFKFKGKYIRSSKSQGGFLTQYGDFEIID